MRNAQLVSVLRAGVLSPEKMFRFKPMPPQEHDAYRVRMELERVCVDLLSDGKVVYCCQFEAAEDY